MNPKLFSPERVAALTAGLWWRPPPADWTYSGVCMWGPSFQPGHLLVARSAARPGGLAHPMVLRQLRRGAAGVICDDPTPFAETTTAPVLVVDDTRQATLDLGAHARDLFQGRVFGVTGSAGKTTTVALLAHALEGLGATGATRASANLPLGVAWNLSTLPRHAAFWVLEMAIGQMAVTSRLVRPQVALVTNVAPAHLEYHKDLNTIAIRKARIFDGMAPGGVAVVCRDIPEFGVFERAAEARGLSVVGYGVHPEASARLVQRKGGRATTVVGGRRLEFELAVPGAHMVLNALGVLAAIDAAGLNAERAAEILPGFRPVAGRGTREQVQVGNKRITLLDEAYNANPLSMQAALASFAEEPDGAGARVLVLGDMLELGADEARYHQELLPHVLAARPHRVLLAGARMKHLADRLPVQVRPTWFPDHETLGAALTDALGDGDKVLFKGSHGSGLHQLIEHLRAQSEHGSCAEA